MMNKDRFKFRTPVYKDGKFWKFLYWDTDTGKIGIASTYRLSYKPDEQWTGLKDKNGKLIYEGNIVKHFGKERLAVSFYEGCFFAGTLMMNGNWVDGYFEIVGNIHEEE